jgi:hypothetical protein
MAVRCGLINAGSKAVHPKVHKKFYDLLKAANK